MAGRRLSAEEDALWARVAATVRPLAARLTAPFASDLPSRESGTLGTQAQPSTMLDARLRGSDDARRRTGSGKVGETLDGGWDRRLRQGIVAPDHTIDLHGHTLAAAHAALDHALEAAIAGDARLLLVVTGRAPRDREGPHRRGLIRLAIGDWLAASRHAGRIAAVRTAHPRHGGAGALYVVLRRRRA